MEFKDVESWVSISEFFIRDFHVGFEAETWERDSRLKV